MIVLAAFSITIVILTAERFFVTRHPETWHLLTAAWALIVCLVVFFSQTSGEHDWESIVLTGFGLWGISEFLQVLYHALLAAGDVLRLIIQRNMRR